MIANRMAVLAAGFLTFAFWVAPASARAQQRASSPFARLAATHALPLNSRPVAPRRTMRAVPTPVRFNAERNLFEAKDGTRVPLRDLLNPYAGAGFSFRHLAVINPDLAVRASIDPAAEWRLSGPGRFRRGSRFAPTLIIWPGGYEYGVPDESAATSDQAADQSAEQQETGEEQEPAAQQSEESSYPEQPPLPDVGQLTLVLQNGEQLQAVAFTHIDDKIVYITADGSRRSIAASDLNPDATVRINEERGTALQLPL